MATTRSVIEPHHHQRSGADEFLLDVRLPRAHSLWSDCGSSYHDPLISIEICRRACLAILRCYYRVPADWHVVSTEIDLSVTSLDAFADNAASPPEGVLRTRHGMREREGLLTAMTVESELTIGGTLAAAVCGELALYPRASYERMRLALRASRPLTRRGLRATGRPMEPARVGRSVDRNVVIEDRSSPRISARERRYGVIVDQTHPDFFDRPYDHLPGALIAEAHRQAAIATVARGEPSLPVAVITGLRARLVDFGELDAPVECSAVVNDELASGCIQVSSGLHQFGSEIAYAQVELSEAGAPRGRARRGTARDTWRRSSRVATRWVRR